MNRLSFLITYSATLLVCLAANPSFVVDASLATGNVSPMFYGLMTEEINHCYDGGLYAELIRNRAFLDNAEAPVHWSALNDHGATASIALDSANEQLSSSLRLAVTQATKEHPAGVANDGYWGIPVQPNTRYRATLFVKAAPNFAGPVTISI